MQIEKSRGERRNSLRHSIHSLAYVRLGEENGGIIINLSENGIAVRTAMAVAEDRVPLLLSPPATSRDSIATTGRIAWKRDAGTLAGIQFVDVPEPTRNRIRTWIAEESSAQVQREARPATRAGNCLPAEPASKTAARLRYESEPTVQKRVTGPGVFVSAHGGPTSDLAANNPTLPRMPGVANAIARPPVLVAVVAALSFIAGWAMGVSFSHPFSGVLSHTMGSLAGKANVPNQSPALSQAVRFASSSKQGWIFLGHITPESTWSADSVKIIRGETWPIKKGDHLAISHEVWVRDGSRPTAHILGRLHVGETVSVDEVALLHAKVGGEFVWAKVSTAAPVKP